LIQIQTSPDYLNHFHKYVFAMIRQLGPQFFFGTFTMGVNNWPTLIETLKTLHDQHVAEFYFFKKWCCIKCLKTCQKWSYDMCMLLLT
jgi:hypothetical protein